MKKIIVLKRITNKEDLFINNIKLKLKDCLVHKLSSTDKVKELVDMLGWERKDDKDKISRLTKELYNVWEDINQKEVNDISTYIKKQFGDNIFFLYMPNDERVEEVRRICPSKVEIVSFNLKVEEDDSNLTEEITRFISELDLSDYA